MVEATSVGGRSACVRKCWWPVKVSKVCWNNAVGSMCCDRMRRQQECLHKGGHLDMADTTSAWESIGMLILGGFKLEIKRCKETGTPATSKDCWLLVALRGGVRSIWPFLYIRVRLSSLSPALSPKSRRGRLDLKDFPRSEGLLCYSNPESPPPLPFLLWGFKRQHLISVSCTRTTFCPRGDEWTTTVVFSSLCKLVNPVASFI